MLFNSYLFLLGFMPITLLLYFGLAGPRGPRASLATLTCASLVFYAWWNPPYVALIVVSMLLNYALGRFLSRSFLAGPGAARRWAAILGVAANLALLGYYKYANFFLGVVGDLTGQSLQMAGLILPLGISFFTFEQVGFVVDAYGGRARDYSFLEYIFFVTFFPHLIAGPIIAHHELLSQLQDRRIYRFDASRLATGVTLFFIGLFKKVVLADNLAPYVGAAFSTAQAGQVPESFAAWLSVLAYALQLYYDFSGYSDMGLGLARMLGFKLPLNFDSPYKAVNIIEFWRRWHMTLSRFLRDYLYIPLGGNRSGRWRRHLNLCITMLLGGLWHGAGWGFLVWGALHGLYLVINHSFRELRGAESLAQERHPWWLREATTQLTFVAVLVGWVFFRAVDFGSAWRMLQAMASIRPAALVAGLRADAGAAALCAVAYAMARLMPNSQEWLADLDPALPSVSGRWAWRWRLSPAWAAVTAVMATAGILGLTRVSEFLYFQF